MRNVGHFIAMFFLVIAATILVYLGLNSLGLMPVAASEQAVPIDWLFNLEIELIAFFFALIMVPLLYSLIVFRRRKGETGDGEHIEGSNALELTWTVIPLILVIALGVIGANNLSQVRAPDPQAIEVDVFASQWTWNFQYPQGGFSSGELYLPVNQQVDLKMQSLDVIHSFWVPEFRVKQDVVPGRVIDLRITPDLVGDYWVRCSELCGLRHALMEGKVHIVSKAVYDKWVADQTAIVQAQIASGIPDPQRGQALYSQLGCKACHSLDGSKGTGPTWRGVFGSKVALTDGSTVTADEAYLIESVKTPNAKIVAPFSPNIMPNFGQILTDLQIKDLVAYIETIK